jgi:hypothetical protein
MVGAFEDLMGLAVDLTARVDVLLKSFSYDFWSLSAVSSSSCLTSP